VTDARRFAEAKSSSLYNGISARYYFSQGMPRYDLVLQPSANPSQIAMRYEGAQDLQVLPNGNLAIHTSLGIVEEQGLYGRLPCRRLHRRAAQVWQLAPAQLLWARCLWRLELPRQHLV
jgi:hypothetical protein